MNAATLQPIPVRGVSRSDAHRLIEATGPDLEDLFQAAAQLRERRTGRIISYSRKVFIPKPTCAVIDVDTAPLRGDLGDPRAHTMTPDEVAAVAEAGRRAGCKEALFSLGERPEIRYPVYREWLADNGYASTIDYLAAMCRLVLERTGLLPHSNPGTMSRDEIEKLQPVNASLGMMLESVSNRLLRPGEAHHGCPDKVPLARLATLKAAGELGVPFTTGILIGIGESLEERVDSLFAIREMHERYGHIQEVIVQNFRAKTDTRFAQWPEPSALDLARTAAVARLIFGSEVNVQIPPNLTLDGYGFLLKAGINDWGGISPVTLDFINPEKAWPKVQRLREVTEEAGFELRERLAVYPEYLRGRIQCLSEPLRARVLALSDETGLVRREEERW